MDVTNLDLTFDEAKAILSDGKLVIASRKELEEAEAAWKERDSLRAQLKASQADVKLLREALELALSMSYDTDEPTEEYPNPCHAWVVNAQTALAATAPKE